MTTAPTPARTWVLRRRIRIVVAITITWNVVEAVVAIVAGRAASSAALIGFGLDSVVEVLSAAAVAWQFAAPDPRRRERTALRVIAVSFFALAAYVTVDAGVSLAGLREAEPSTVGIALAALSLVVMPFLSWFERRTGRELGSASAVADSKQTLICSYLSAALLLGLLMNGLLGWAWADSLAALVIAAFAVREGREALRGDGCCSAPPGLLTGERRPDTCRTAITTHVDGGHTAMHHIGPLTELPVACTLTPEAGADRLARWRAFDEANGLSVERTGTRITVHYVRTAESVRRLRELVAAETACCGFVTWEVDDTHADLRLVVTGHPEGLAALGIASPGPGR